MKAFFHELLEYSHHFNQKLGDIFIESPDKTSERSIRLYNHILNAHQVWNNRIEPKQPAFGIWEIHPVGDWKDIEEKNHEHSLSILERFELNGRINYTNTRGMTFNNCIRDVLFHMINHATYHRGQIATEFRQGGLTPLVTDYIFYKRG